MIHPLPLEYQKQEERQSEWKQRLYRVYNKHSFKTGRERERERESAIKPLPKKENDRRSRRMKNILRKRNRKTRTTMSMVADPQSNAQIGLNLRFFFAYLQNSPKPWILFLTFYTWLIIPITIAILITHHCLCYYCCFSTYPGGSLWPLHVIIFFLLLSLPNYFYGSDKLDPILF